MMEELINMITSNGIGVVCLAYMIYDHCKIQKRICENMENQSRILTQICDKIGIGGEKQ